MTVDAEVVPGPEVRATELLLGLAGDARRWQQTLMSAHRELSRAAGPDDPVPGIDVVHGAGAATGVLLDRLRRATDAEIWIPSAAGMVAGLDRLPAVPSLRVLVGERVAGQGRMPWLSGCDARVAAGVRPGGPDAVVIDGSAVLLLSRPAGPEPYAMIITQGGLAGLVRAMFDLVWPAAAALPGEAAGRSADAELKRQITRRLADGGKDEAISRALGISLRTCRRYIAEILADAGAVSRFQAGYRLGRGHLAGAR